MRSEKNPREINIIHNEAFISYIQVYVQGDGLVWNKDNSADRADMRV